MSSLGKVEGIAIAAAVVVVGVLVWKGVSALKALPPDTFNVGSADNAAYKGVNAIGAALNKAPDDNGKNADGSWSFGGWLSDVTSGSNDKIKAMLKGG